MALTDKEIHAPKPRKKRYKVTDGDGLFLLVHPAGGKYWYLKYSLGGRPQEVVFAAYPAVSLTLAHEKRQDAAFDTRKLCWAVPASMTTPYIVILQTVSVW